MKKKNLQERIWNMLITAPASRGTYQSSRDVPMEMTQYAVLPSFPFRAL